ncbi:polymer-forming cytoskeletal protein [Aestuariicella hydrocarbonica]|uniref:Polymer-forming cytoskeletal protein n=2 Tax=Pseudomaricurvus hydrocarbonicus TaxID=1470433 RepID=A0A9E5T272_9GAMM|nr:polymer-forming cytoskeletal protein [Aestuariicella hydrocarbonica]
MWGKKEKAMGFATGGTTLISKSTELLGDINFDGNLEIEGRVKGNIFADAGSDARVRIMEKGFVEGEIRVPTVVVNGSVTGDVYAAKHIELAAKATVDGNVHYNMIEMVKGAQVNGSLVFSEKSDKTDAKNAFERAEAADIDSDMELAST